MKFWRQPRVIFCYWKAYKIYHSYILKHIVGWWVPVESLLNLSFCWQNPHYSCPYRNLQSQLECLDKSLFTLFCFLLYRVYINLCYCVFHLFNFKLKLKSFVFKQKIFKLKSERYFRVTFSHLGFLDTGSTQALSKRHKNKHITTYTTARR